MVTDHAETICKAYYHRGYALTDRRRYFGQSQGAGWRDFARSKRLLLSPEHAEQYREKTI